MLLVLLLCVLPVASDGGEQHRLADQRHVPALRGGQRHRAPSGRQEAQVQHQDQEQQLVTKVQ